jgi:hypothetical protein
MRKLTPALAALAIAAMGAPASAATTSQRAREAFEVQAEARTTIDRTAEEVEAWREEVAPIFVLHERCGKHSCSRQWFTWGTTSWVPRTLKVACHPGGENVRGKGPLTVCTATLGVWADHAETWDRGCRGEIGRWSLGSNESPIYEEWKCKKFGLSATVGVELSGGGWADDAPGSPGYGP